MLMGSGHLLAQADSDSQNVAAQFDKSLWIGLDVAQSLIVLNSTDPPNVMIEPYVEYRIRDRWSVYANFNYAQRKGVRDQNFHSWNESYVLKSGFKYLPQGKRVKVSVGAGLVAHRFQEVNKFVLGGSYYGNLDLFPNNSIYTGVGVELPVGFWIYLTHNIALRVDLAYSGLFTWNMEDTKTVNGFTYDYRVAGLGLLRIGRSFQDNLNLGLSINYRIDW